MNDHETDEPTGSVQQLPIGDAPPEDDADWAPLHITRSTDDDRYSTRTYGDGPH